MGCERGIHKIAQLAQYTPRTERGAWWAVANARGRCGWLMWRGRNGGVVHSRPQPEEEFCCRSSGDAAGCHITNNQSRGIDPVELACLRDFLTASVSRCDGIFAVSIGPPLANLLCGVGPDTSPLLSIATKLCSEESI